MTKKRKAVFVFLLAGITILSVALGVTLLRALEYKNMLAAEILNSFKAISQVTDDVDQWDFTEGNGNVCYAMRRLALLKEQVAFYQRTGGKISGDVDTLLMELEVLYNRLDGLDEEKWRQAVQLLCRLLPFLEQMTYSWEELSQAQVTYNCRSLDQKMKQLTNYVEERNEEAWDIESQALAL